MQPRPWLAQYPTGVPAEIDVDEFPSVVSVLERAISGGRDVASLELAARSTVGDRRPLRSSVVTPHGVGAKPARRPQRPECVVGMFRTQ